MGLLTLDWNGILECDILVRTDSKSKQFLTITPQIYFVTTGNKKLIVLSNAFFHYAFGGRIFLRCTCWFGNMDDLYQEVIINVKFHFLFR